MSSASSSARRSARRGTGRLEHTSTSVNWFDMPHAARSGGRGTCELLLADSQYATRTAGDDRLEVDDCVGKRGAVERLAGHFEGGEEEWRGHHTSRCRVVKAKLQ